MEEDGALELERQSVCLDSAAEEGDEEAAKGRVNTVFEGGGERGCDFREDNLVDAEVVDGHCEGCVFLADLGRDR